MNENSKNIVGRSRQRRVLLALAVIVTLVALFYLEEDWRGKRAWAKCKAGLEARGMVTDWNQYIPPPVPNDQNFFTASTNILLRFHKAQTQAQSDAATQLPWLRLPPLGSNSYPVLDPAKCGPLVVAELTFVPSSSVSARTNSIAWYSDPATRVQVCGVLGRTVGRSIQGATGIEISEVQLSNLAPTRVVLQANSSPGVAELESFISPVLVTNLGRLRVEVAGAPGTFRVLLTNVQVTAAADYLKWSDQFVPAFEEIREALKRPYAILPGDYSQPYLIPIPNFVTMRSVAQTLAQRAQCHLLLGEPDDALRELTLMHDLCRILQKPPTGKPETLVEAMINVAITGLYVNTIADGLHWQAWQEPQLTAFQEQLKSINLPLWVAESFREELAASVPFFESTPADKISSVITSVYPFAKSPGLWTHLKDPMYLYLKLAPRGWRYQNLVNMASLTPKPLDSFDLENETISPRIFAKYAHNLDKFLVHKSPFKTLAAMAIPNYTKAVQVTGYNQTLANEAQIVCALERFRLAHGEYPATLDALIPQFIEKLPHDIIGGQSLHYRRTDDGKFLLYSVGWNERDDGGKAAFNKTGGVDYGKGDWVWQNSAK
jgi:hypothetical protein